MQRGNIAERAGRWSAQHRKKAIIGWLLFVVLATVIGGGVGQQTLESSKMGNGESKQHDMMVDAAGYPKEIGERVLIQGKGSLRSDGPEVTAAVEDVVTGLESTPGVKSVEKPIKSEDGRSVLVDFSLPATDKEHDTEYLEKAAVAPLATVAAVQKAHPDVRVEEFGDASYQKAMGAKQRADEAREQQISMGGTLLILLLTFGAAVAAGVPLLLGITSIAATIGLLGPVSQLSSLHAVVAQVVFLIGLAVAVDYAMFYMRRMTQEQDKGRSPRRRSTSPRPRPGVPARLQLHGDRRDGRDVVLRQRDLHVARHRPSSSSPSDRQVAHVPPRRTIVPRAEGLPQEGPPALHRQAAPRQQGRVAGLDAILTSVLARP